MTGKKAVTGAAAEKALMTGQNKDKEADLLIGVTAIKPVGWERKGFESLRYTLWNPDTGEILTRTPLSWLCIIGFYLVYYSCLAGFWIACLQIFFQTLPEVENGPRWKLKRNIIGTNPGVGVRPGPTDKRIDSQMYFLKTNTTGPNVMIPSNVDGEGDKNIDNAIRLQKYVNQHYKNSTWSPDLIECPETETGIRSKWQQGCLFNMAVLDKCQHYPYGFVSEEEGAPIEPCLYIKLNKIWNWKPQALNEKDLETEKYRVMPEHLKKIIRDSEDKNYIWIDCHGIKPADKEVFHVDYYPPNQGIPLKYFPYRGGDYERPIVALKFTRENGKNPAGRLIHGECKAWYKGVEHSSKYRMGLARFEMFFDDKIKKPITPVAEVTPETSVAEDAPKTSETEDTPEAPATDDITEVQVEAPEVEEGVEPGN